MSLNINTKFEYNGMSYDFDARDAEYAETLEEALEILRTEEKELPKDGKASSMILSHCSMLKRFFDNVLGEGAGVAICTERNNLSVCYDAYEKFLLLVREQKEDVLEAKNVFAKYSNRQQRREKKKANK